MKQFDLDAILDRTRSDRTDRLAVLFDGPRLVPAPPENLFLTAWPFVDGPVIAQQFGTKVVLVMPLGSVREPLRSWLLAVIPARDAEAFDEDGDSA